MFVVSALGIALGALFLFAPIQGYCMQSITATPPPPGATLGPTATPVSTCGFVALWQHQPIFPMPFFAVLVWSLAPVLGYTGARMRAIGPTTGPGTLVIALALVTEASVLVSFGAAPYFVPFVFVPLLIATALALRSS